MKLFEVTYNTDLSVIGAYPQIKHYFIKEKEIINPYEGFFGFWKQFDAIKFDMRGNMDLDSIRTHVLSCSQITPSIGILVEDWLISIIQEYLPENCLLHNFEVNDLMNSNVYYYKLIEVYRDFAFYTIINYEKSSFYESYFGDYKRDVNITSWQDWLTKQQEENKKGSSLSIEPKELYVDSKFFEKTGIINFPFDSTIYFTEPLAQVIKERQITGIEMRETKKVKINLY